MPCSESPRKNEERELSKVKQGLSLTDMALASARAATQGVARSPEGGVVSHGEWVRQVHAWRAAFQRVEGSEVGLYFDDPLVFSAALWGAWHAGKTPVLASDLQAHTLAHLLPTVQACAGLLPQALQPDDAFITDATLCPLQPDSAQIVLFTSGSTGQPERIVKRLAQLDAEVHALEAAFGHLLAADALDVLATVSHQHIYGLLFRVLWPLSAGRAMGVRMLRYPEELQQQLALTRDAVLVSSPAMLGRLPEHLEWAAVSGRLRAIFSSGGPLAADASVHCQQLLGRSPTEVFGSSETGGIAWRRRAEHGDQWQPLPGVEWRLAESDCLAVRSAHLPHDQQWWETADRVTPSADGTGFVLQGRVDRVVKIAEKRVSLTAMEQALWGHPSVQQAKAVTLEQAHGTLRIGMVVELTPAGWLALQQQGRRAMANDLRARLSPYVERVALPRSFRYVVQMPMNAQGKTTQQSLANLFNPLMPQPQWLERSAHQATARLQISADLRVLEGHFPGATLVPGVAQLHWVVTLGAQAFGIDMAFPRAEVVKFQQPILPGDGVEVQLQWSPAKRCLQFALVSARGAHASGRLVQEQGA